MWQMKTFALLTQNFLPAASPKRLGITCCCRLNLISLQNGCSPQSHWYLDPFYYTFFANLQHHFIKFISVHFTRPLLFFFTRHFSLKHEAGNEIELSASRERKIQFLSVFFSFFLFLHPQSSIPHNTHSIYPHTCFIIRIPIFFLLLTGECNYFFSPLAHNKWSIFFLPLLFSLIYFGGKREPTRNYLSSWQEILFIV